VSLRLERPNPEPRPNGLVLVLAGHVLAAAWTWRDIRQRPAQQIRGSKGLWRLLSAVNTLGTVAYWLIGRRYGARPGRTPIPPRSGRCER